MTKLKIEWEGRTAIVLRKDDKVGEIFYGGVSGEYKFIPESNKSYS